MSRQPTPANILADVLTADVATPDRTALRNRLRWDYSQVAPVDRKAVEDAAVDILANGQRMQQSVIAIGERLIAVKRLLDHGQFGDWCDTEFSMSIRTAQNLMNVAREFSGKNETVSLLTDSAMYLLAAPSTPPAAREQAIDEAQATGKSPTKERVREIIAEHKPGPALQPIPAPTDKEYSAAVQAAQPARPVYSAISNPDPVVAANAAAATVQIIEYDAAAPLPSWADEPAPTHYTATQPHDERIGRAQRLMALYGAVIDSEEEYGQLTGRFSDTLAMKRELTHMISHLSDLIAIIQRPEEAA
ncbi:MAG: DUF3102 domain-containing protein [Caldilineaceae bacterium]|nr:DUF3102 domain-containing protein [Caldilineaceae bacterium]